MAQGHAPYAQLYYKVAGDSNDMLVAEIRPTITPTYTYFNALSWKGGYTGLQTTTNGPAFIFSLWDPTGTEHSPTIRSLYSAPGGLVDRFGGEGTGLHYLNSSAPWQPNRWYRFVVRCWGSGSVTDYALWTQDEQTGVWTHHVTMETPEPHFRFNSFVVSFLEDWQGTPDKKRRVEYRGIKVRSAGGQWQAINQANSAIYKEVTGHGPFEHAIDVGIGDGTYFLQSGGDTKSNLPIPSTLVLKHPAETQDSATSPQPDAAPKSAPFTIHQARASLKGRTVTVRWLLAPATAPQFIYKLELFDNPQAAGRALAEKNNVAPDAFDVSLDLPMTPKAMYLRLTLTDIFDRQVSRVIAVTP